MYSFRSTHTYAGMATHMYEEVYPKYLIVEWGGVGEAHYPSAQVSNPCHLNETPHQQSTALLNLNLPALPLTSNILRRRT